VRNLISACVLVAVMALGCTPSQGSPSSKSSATTGCQAASPTGALPGEVQGPTGLVFPVSGCWDVHVSVGQVTGDVYVVVS
jgi:hypothetical protein